MMELEELEKTMNKQPANKSSRAGARRPKSKLPPKGRDEFGGIADELRKLAELDGRFADSFDLEKYPRVKQALEDAVSARVEEIIRQRFADKPGRDFNGVSLNQLIEVTGKGRRTIYFWIRRGLPREDDGTFLLSKFFGWYEKYITEKLAVKNKEVDPMREQKLRQLRMHIDEQMHHLLDRGEVLAGLAARVQKLVDVYAHRSGGAAAEAANQPLERVAEILNSLFDQLLESQTQVPEQLHLPEDVEKQFMGLLESLKDIK